MNTNLSSSNGTRSVQAIVPNSQFSNCAFILTLVSGYFFAVYKILLSSF